MSMRINESEDFRIKEDTDSGVVVLEVWNDRSFPIAHAFGMHLLYLYSLHGREAINDYMIYSINVMKKELNRGIAI